MNSNINHLLACDSYVLEVFCDRLEENATTACDQNLYLFLRARQHEERGFCRNVYRPPATGYSFGDGYGYGNGEGDGYGFGDGSGYGDGWGWGYGNGCDNGDGEGDGDEGNLRQWRWQWLWRWLQLQLWRCLWLWRQFGTGDEGNQDS
jgi:hypothetical protein